MDAALLAEFEDRGVVRLEGAFSEEDAAAMREVVWAHAERCAGVRQHEPGTWASPPVIGWKPVKRHRAFAPLMASEAVRGALDAVFGAGGWKQPRSGPQILFTLPGAAPWTLPDGWHMDAGFERSGTPTYAVKLFAFLGASGPEGGTTMLLPGSHRLVERYRRTLPPGTGGGLATWRPFLRQDPWLASLLDGARMPDRGRSLVGAVHEVDGVPLEVLETTGRPGDVFVTHLHVFHTASPNASAAPRQMLGQGVLRDEGTPTS